MTKNKTPISFSTKEKLTRFVSKNPVGEIDHDKGIIYGVSIITLGEAQGHEMYVDEIMLDQVVALGREKEDIGLKCRFDHANACTRSIGSFAGRFHNIRRDGDHDRGDLHLAQSAAKSPDGDIRGYILSLADEDPKAFATSIVFRRGEDFMPDPANKVKAGFPPEDDPYWLPHARAEALHHCDVVDEGAANDGLFGRDDYWGEQAEKWAEEHPNVVGKIMSAYFERKQKKENGKMDEAKFEEMKKELAAALSKGKEHESNIIILTSKNEDLTKELATKIAEAETSGKAVIFALITDRIEKFEDRDFVLETIELSDDEVKDKYIEHLKKGKPDGEKPVDFTETPDDDGDKEKFEDKVKEKTEDGMKKGKAISACASEYPELHKEYVARTNEAHKK